MLYYWNRLFNGKDWLALTPGKSLSLSLLPLCAFLLTLRVQKRKLPLDADKIVKEIFYKEFYLHFT